VTPTSGTVELFGLGTERRGESLTRVGAVIDTSAYYPYLSGRRNLLALCRLHPGVPTQRVDEMLDLVGLRGAANRRAGQYSLGMKQQLTIAGALLHHPQLLVLDEPTNGLDPAGILEVSDHSWQCPGLGALITPDGLPFDARRISTRQTRLCVFRPSSCRTG
jgi:ABC-2 type transport system ATP-binding protein